MLLDFFLLLWLGITFNIPNRANSQKSKVLKQTYNYILSKKWVSFVSAGYKTAINIDKITYLEWCYEISMKLLEQNIKLIQFIGPSSWELNLSNYISVVFAIYWTNKKYIFSPG